jgi:hypothetical protein
VFRKAADPLISRQKEDANRWAKTEKPAIEMKIQIKKATMKYKMGGAKKGLSDEKTKELIDLQTELGKLELSLISPVYYGEDYTIEALGVMLGNIGEQLACISSEALSHSELVRVI